MTNYFVRENGRTTIIDDDIFDMIWQSIDNDDKLLTAETEESATSDDNRKIKKKHYNDVLNKEYKENGYFKDYYKEHDKPFECEKCNCKLNSSTHKARHQKSKKCIMKQEEIRQSN